MTMALSIRNYFMIPVFVLCIALFYPVSGEPERLIQSVTPKGDYGAEAVLTCSLKTVTDKTVVYWIFGDKNITVGTDNASSNTTASSTTAVTKDGTEMGTTASTTVTETPRFTETSTQPTTIKEKSETKSGITSSTNVHVETTDATVTSVTPTLNDTSTDSTAFTKYETETGKTTTENSTNKYKTDIKGQEFIFKIANATEADALNYTCVTEGDHKGVYLNLSFPGKLLKMEPDKDPVIFQLTEGIDEKDRILNLTCVFEVYNQLEIKWILRGGKKEIEKTTRNGTRNNKQLIDTYTEKMRAESFDDQDGTYICQVWDPHSERYLEGKKVVKIIARPTVEINFAKAIGSSEIYFNWTVKNFNSDIKLYELSYRNSSSGQYQYVQDASEKINVTATHYILKNLSSNTAYYLRLRVKTFEYSVNYAVLKNSTEYPNGMVTTLAEDPIFVPNISINGFTARSMTIGMSAPPPDIAEYVHYYQLQEWKKSNPANTTKEAMHIRDERNLPFMFSDLDPHTTYVFKAQACFKYGDMPARCGKWSKEMEAITMDGIPNEPSNVSIHCGGSIDEGYHMNLTWDAPSKPNAEIKGYMMELTGNSSYIDRFGKWKLDTFGPLSKFLTNVTFFTRTLDLKPNMNYTARLMALTRSRRRGQEAEAACGTARAPPDAPPRPRWRKVEENINNERKYSLRVLVPRVAERNGPICCYRVYLVRLPYGKGWIPTPPQDLPVISYDDAHPENPDQYQAVGAYVTDIFNHSPFPPGEIILGDDKMYNIEDDNGTCARCRRAPPRAEPPPARAPPAPAPAPAPATAAPADHDDVAADVSKAKRSADVRGKEIKVQDGPLYRYSNYTLFVELIPADGLSSLYSGYTMALNTDTPPDIVAANAMETALQICCGVAAFLLLATLIFCIVHTRRARKQPPRHAHVELNPIQAALRYVVGHIGGRTPLAPAPPPELPPLAVEDLAAAYAERQADSDYGFQKEFELLQMLPECYPDRTTHASEARENQPKNRYPDIKAYDQTRVKLQQIDGITGSDYINANYVMGYKLKEYEQEKVASEGYWQNIELEEDEEYNHREHKQFICAQGPTDTTVNDFWRMIWEGGLELIVMLTNLEEYSKVKCSKYWPDEDRGSRAFGSITVHHVSEKRYSDYIVRELKIVKQATNSDGQPIVENNGIAKRNGDCKDAESGSVPTSPREVKEDSSRIVRQYHFLMWKDFAAPEHPQSILKFIKRMNEAWSHLMGRPVVVHCSAGVGRTGTLVALDCLLEQLRETRCAAVFTTVAELRRQRNFLVQSLKQYVFVYRALVEYAHYGDTEIPASRLKSSIDRLRNTPEGADKCLMEHQFEKMMNPPVSEPVKSCSAGAVEEARAKNRSPECLPYDRNRVILAPATHTSYSTYINASFIEAYDNSEGYIITQDPLPNTITDFWRMVSEHNVSTIVMLSELGDGKCPRYWDDGTAQYDHISVQYEESESCPYYTRRQFRVTNNKSGDVSTVRQLQYHGWPTAPGHVPEVTRGLAELADAARGPPAMLLHCQHGTERSALFAALCILIAQLRTERRVDVAATARKVRSQRINTINTFLQYEFLHRAILNYAELHNLLEDS